MRFGKLKMFLLLQGVALTILVVYFSIWLTAEKSTAVVVAPFYSNMINIEYSANETTIRKSLLRFDVPFDKRKVRIRYLGFHPASARINSFMGIFAEPLAWWLVYLLASSMLLLTHNTVFSKGTIFQLHKRFPWISMDEYFPAPHQRNHSQERKQRRGEKKEQRKLKGNQSGDP